MKADMNTWLISSAEKLRAGVKDELDIEKLLNGFEISMVSESSTNRSGALAQVEDGKWLIIVRGQRHDKIWTVVDRFTAAHEFGHYLLQKHWAFAPAFADKRNYYDCETLCNQFAARLLVDYNAVSKVSITSPKECLGVIRNLAERYQVSVEVVARAIVETHPGIGICAFRNDLAGESRRLWGLSSLNGISPRYPGKRVNADSIRDEVLAWGRKLIGTQFRERLDFATESIEPTKKTIKSQSGVAEKENQSNRGNHFSKTELSVVLLKPPGNV